MTNKFHNTKYMPSEDKKYAVCRMYKEGAPLEDIQRLTGLGCGHIYTIIDDAGILRRKAKRKRVSADVLDADKDATQRCARCGLTKSNSLFSLCHNGEIARRHPYCKKCVAEYQRERRYGCTNEVLAQFVVKQNGGCAVCAIPLNLSETKKFHVDHCHAKNVIRGILCYSCNLRLGGWDEPGFKEKALKYLGFVNVSQPAMSSPNE